jgi:hypothetical protein
LGEPKPFSADEEPSMSELRGGIRKDETATSRRNFVGGMAAAAGAMFAPRFEMGAMRDKVPNETLNIAMVGAGEVERVESLPGQKSLTFSKIVGTTYPAAQFPKQDYLIDPSRFDSEGNWAFCRFTSEEIPAVRMGLQRGGFNITATKQIPDKSRLQLHLEIMTKDGAILWVPSGKYPSNKVITNLGSMKIQLRVEGREIFSIRGWPDMEWRFRSEDGEAEVNLQVKLSSVTVLPDCILPRCVFSMWEAMGDARGVIRYRNQTFSVDGKVFYDHPRIIHRPSSAVPRKMYLYTTMYFEDGSGMFGFHAVDEKGISIDYYCFGVYIDASGRARFLSDARLTRLTIDQENTPKHWQLHWRNKELAIEADIRVRSFQLLRSWGSQVEPAAPSDFPLVLDGQARITGSGNERTLLGRGLAEYYNADV